MRRIEKPPGAKPRIFDGHRFIEFSGNSYHYPSGGAQKGKFFGLTFA